MKITFTGITKEDAIKKLEAAAIEKRAFAARMTANYSANSIKAIAEREEHRACELEALIRTIEAAEDNSISISMNDMTNLYYALAEGLNTFDAAASLYMVTPETEEEADKLLWNVRLAEGERVAAKTENL